MLRYLKTDISRTAAQHY